ncbi:MAG: winged helix-turn-helix transcriptional regulator [Candidatus Thorarchaeota archaeon]|nr:MAG: winged helix-turn-helix transcriptional regulator [Candidatus Thorarchaeota archaeon]
MPRIYSEYSCSSESTIDDFRLLLGGVCVDPIDKGILWDMRTDCRQSYQSLARKYGLTANAIRGRIDRLIKSGIIEGFQVVPSLTMMMADFVIALVTPDGSHNPDELIEKIGQHPMVLQLAYMTNNDCFVYGEYSGTSGLHKLGAYLRGIDGVSAVQLHPLITERGGRLELKNHHLLVLKELRDDARMSVAEIATRTGLTARRVRSAIADFTESDAIRFSIQWALNAGGSNAFFVFTSWDEEKTNLQGIEEWLSTKFPEDYWLSFVSAVEPLIISIFVVPHLSQSAAIQREVRSAPFVIEARTLLVFPSRKFQGLRHDYLDTVLAGIGEDMGAEKRD